MVSTIQKSKTLIKVGVCLFAFMSMLMYLVNWTTEGRNRRNSVWIKKWWKSWWHNGTVTEKERTDVFLQILYQELDTIKFSHFGNRKRTCSPKFIVNYSGLSFGRVAKPECAEKKNSMFLLGMSSLNNEAGLWLRNIVVSVIHIFFAA